MFRGALKTTLDSIHRALSEVLPTARATGASAGAHRSTCLSCEQRVRSNSDVANILSSGKLLPGSPMRCRMERAVSPERVPSPSALAPRRAISTAEPLGARHNARLVARYRANEDAWGRAQGGTPRKRPAKGGESAGSVDEQPDMFVGGPGSASTVIALGK